MKKPKILVIGSFMMDLIASAPRVPAMGETVIGSSFATAPGGKGANQALQCARLGAEVTMAGCVGDDAFGREMCDTLRQAGIDTSHVKVSQKSASGVGHIQLQVEGNTTQNRILVVPGANYDLTTEDLSWLKTDVQNYDLVMLQLELSMEVTLFAAKTAHQAGVPVMLNPAPAAPLSDELLGCITYLSPNEHEAVLLAGVALEENDIGTNREHLRLVTQQLCGKGVGKLLITLGSNGSVLVENGSCTFADAVKIPVVKDPTAAGDSFVAAFCTGVCAGLAEQEAMVMASHVAGITVSRMGAMPSLPKLNEACDFLMSEGYNEIAKKLEDAMQ